MLWDISFLCIVADWPERLIPMAIWALLWLTVAFFKSRYRKMCEYEDTKK
jgi:hypothetical protein